MIMTIRILPAFSWKNKMVGPEKQKALTQKPRKA